MYNSSLGIELGALELMDHHLPLFLYMYDLLVVQVGVGRSVYDITWVVPINRRWGINKYSTKPEIKAFVYIRR